MSIQFFTDDPTKLLADFKKKITDKKVDAWQYDSAGDFTHTASLWGGKAWLRPVTESDRLRFNIIKTENIELTWVLYSIYHRSLVESFMTHCRHIFCAAKVTSVPTAEDHKPTS
jgi:hypothetical protein